MCPTKKGGKRKEGDERSLMLMVKSEVLRLTALYKLRPSRRGERWHPGSKRQREICVLGTPNAGRPPHPLPPRNLDLGKTSAWDRRGKKFLDELQLKNVLALFPTFGSFVCVDHLPTEIRTTPKTHDLLDCVCPRGHQLDRRPIVPDIRCLYRQRCLSSESPITRRDERLEGTDQGSTLLASKRTPLRNRRDHARGGTLIRGTAGS